MTVFGTIVKMIQRFFGGRKLLARVAPLRSKLREAVLEVALNDRKSTNMVTLDLS
jgi:hypothetical protein